MVRYLLTHTYQPDPKLRDVACRGIALAAKYHPKQIRGIVQRLIWAMSEDSGANAANAPEVLAAIAEEVPELLRNKIADLIRLAKDSEVNEGLSATLRRLAEIYPGEVGGRLSRELNNKIIRGASSL